jgi:hypothetical protein
LVGWLVGWLVGCLVGWFGHSVGYNLDQYEKIGKVFVLGKCAKKFYFNDT